MASAADSVMVMTKSVAANPSRHRTNALPCQRGSSSSSIEMLPWPCGLSSATRLYIGSAPNSVSSTRTSVAIGESSAGGEERDARLVAERREVVDAGEAHDLPPGRLVDVRCACGPSRLADALEEPELEPALLPRS